MDVFRKYNKMFFRNKRDVNEVFYCRKSFKKFEYKASIFRMREYMSIRICTQSPLPFFGEGDR